MSEPHEGWAILELMGHRKLGALISEYTVAGKAFLRADIPQGDGFATQFYSGDAIYCITPTTEETARALRFFTPPVSRWELPPAREIGGAKSGTAISTIDDLDDDPTLDDPNMDETLELGDPEDPDAADLPGLERAGGELPGE